MTLSITIIRTAILQYSQLLQHHVRKPLQQAVQLPELPIRIPIKPQPVNLLSMMLMIMTTQRISMRIISDDFYDYEDAEDYWEENN